MERHFGTVSPNCFILSFSLVDLQFPWPSLLDPNHSLSLGMCVKYLKS